QREQQGQYGCGRRTRFGQRLESEASERLCLAIDVRKRSNEELASGGDRGTGHDQAACCTRSDSQSSGGVPSLRMRLSNKRTLLSRPDRTVRRSCSPVRSSRATTLSLPCLI